MDGALNWCIVGWTWHARQQVSRERQLVADESDIMGINCSADASPMLEGVCRFSYLASSSHAVDVMRCRCGLSDLNATMEAVYCVKLAARCGDCVFQSVCIVSVDRPIQHKWLQMRVRRHNLFATWTAGRWRLAESWSVALGSLAGASWPRCAAFDVNVRCATCCIQADALT